MKFELEKGTEYDSTEDCFYLDVEKEEEGLVVEMDIVTIFSHKTKDVSRKFICEVVSHDDAIRLRDYLNEVYPQWISVDDKLPAPEPKPFTKPYLVRHCDGSYSVTPFCSVIGKFNFERPKVTHWMPIHEPTKEATMTKPVNCIFAVHFDDDKDPRYLELCKLLVSAGMWTGGNLVTSKNCNSKDEMLEILETNHEL